jgi:flavin-dependent thymidylate synthase
MKVLNHLDIDKPPRLYEPKGFLSQNNLPSKSTGERSLLDPIINPEDVDHPKFGEWIHPYHVSEAIRDHHQDSIDLYNRIVNAGISEQQARNILPQNLYVNCYLTLELEELLKFIDLRTHEGAQWEITKAAEACLEIATDLWPEAVGAFRRGRG